MDAKSTYRKMKADYFAQFDKQGEDHVRLMVKGPLTSSSAEHRMRRGFAIEWLAQFDRQSRLDAEAERAENKRMARSAKNAAWAAAVAAIIAAVAAIASAVSAFWQPLS